MFRKKRSATRTSLANCPSPVGPDAENAGGDLGLGHLNLVQRVGLRDDVLAGFYNNQSREVFPGFSLRDSDVLVDVGCGGGGPLGFCVRHAGRVIAMDLDLAALERCRSSPELRDATNIEFVHASSEAIPIDDGTATKVMCLEVLEHVDDPRAALNELVRIGRPGSRYLISVPDPRSETIMKRLAPPGAFERPHHIRVIETEQFEQLVIGSGLEIESHDFVGGYSTLFVATYWCRTQQLGKAGESSMDPNFAQADPVLNELAAAWNHLLDRDHGPELKQLLDQIIPKSQVIVAVKPDRILSGQS